MAFHGFDPHDHMACRIAGLSEAESRCAREGLQFTAVRRRVLEILYEDHKPLGAYDILDRLKSEGMGSQPPVAYRALDFLVANGFAHRIERLNAFIACHHPGKPHSPIFLICQSCNSVVEGIADLPNGNLGAFADKMGFRVDRVVSEAEGICPSCRAGGAA